MAHAGTGSAGAKASIRPVAAPPCRSSRCSPSSTGQLRPEGLRGGERWRPGRTRCANPCRPLLRAHARAAGRDQGRRAQDDRAVRRGTELHILAADTAGSHGLRPAGLWSTSLRTWTTPPRRREFFDSLWAGLAKDAGGRGIVITTAGIAGALRPRRLRGSQERPAVAGYRHPLARRRGSIRPRSNPSVCDCSPSVFARLWLNEWAVADDAIADETDVDAACTLPGPLEPQQGVRYICTVDLGTRHDRTVAVIAHHAPTASPGGGRHVIVDRCRSGPQSRCGRCPSTTSGAGSSTSPRCTTTRRCITTRPRPT